MGDIGRKDESDAAEATEEVELLLPLEFAAGLVIAAGGSEKVESIVEKEVRLPGAISEEGAGVGSDIVVEEEEEEEVEDDFLPKTLLSALRADVAIGGEQVADVHGSRPDGTRWWTGGK
jgi:hypothetical protein